MIEDQWKEWLREQYLEFKNAHEPDTFIFWHCALMCGLLYSFHPLRAHSLSQ